MRKKDTAEMQFLRVSERHEMIKQTYNEKIEV